MLEATLVFLQENDNVLLGLKKRGYGEGKWNGIGGKVQPGESVYDAMVRECQEEIGVTPTACQKLGVLAVMQCDMRVHIYRATAWQGEPRESDEMIPAWFTQADVPYGAMWPDDRQWLPELLRQGEQALCQLIRLTETGVEVYGTIEL